VEVAASARKHGISDADILHAWRNVLRVAEQDYGGEAGSSPSAPPVTALSWSSSSFPPTSRPG
jgi:transposase-like protein